MCYTKYIISKVTYNKIVDLRVPGSDVEVRHSCTLLECTVTDGVGSSHGGTLDTFLSGDVRQGPPHCTHTIITYLMNIYTS